MRNLLTNLLPKVRGEVKVTVQDKVLWACVGSVALIVAALLLRSLL